MTYATKANGFRNIVVDGTRFRWRLLMGKDGGAVTLQGIESGGQQAFVTLKGVQDRWLAFPEQTKNFVLTPNLVRQMVMNALSSGWNPARKAPPILVDFEIPNDIG